MLHKSLSACVLFLLGAVALGAADRFPAQPSFPGEKAEAASGVTAGSSLFVTTVLDLPADCVRPQNTPAGLDPEICSEACSVARCVGATIYSPCGAIGGGRVCVPGPTCGGTSPGCTCTFA